MKLNYEKTERYPDYILTPDEGYFDFSFIELTEEEYTAYNEIAIKYDEWQEKIYDLIEQKWKSESKLNETT